MDLVYQAHGANQTRLRLFNQMLGANVDFSALDSEKQSVFSIWCDDVAPPSDQYHVWWKTTGAESIDKIVLDAKKDLSLRKHIDIMVMEHVGYLIDNLTWFVLVSKDNVVRTFQNETDVCSYLKELIARYEHE